MEPTTAAPSTIGFLLIPDFPLMSYAAAVEPLRAANHLAGRELFRWWHASPDGQPVFASNQVAILPDIQIGEEIAAPARVFVCAGGNPSTFKDRRVFSWLRRLARHGVQIGGISGGPYVLARAGLLDRRRCTLHWEHVPAFQEMFPTARVARSLFEVDSGRITCSGGIAALDLMLHLIGNEHGTALATAVSDWFLHNQMREGLSPQRMAGPLRFGVHDPRLVRVLETIEANLERPLSREALAAIACLSVRQLERIFHDAVGQTLHRHYLEQRIRQAERLQRESASPLSEIAQATGFTSVAELRRARKRSESRPSSDMTTSTRLALRGQ